MQFIVNYKKSALVSLAALVFAIINGFVLFPSILKFILKHNLRLVSGSQTRPLFDRIPFPLTFKVYIFNITNSDDVINGAKPILTEIGPFMFDEWKIREDLIDDEAKDTVTYTLKDRFHFRPDLSHGLTGDEMVTVPHLIITGVVMAVKRDRAAMMPLVVKALTSIFDNPRTPFMTVKVMDLLFNGFVFECAGKDFASRAICNGMKSEGAQVKTLNETFISVSMLGKKNETNVGRFTIFRGKQNIHDMGRIITVDDESSHSTWEGDDCNRIIGTDSTIFPPFLKPSDGLWTYAPDICMSLKATYLGKSSYAGLPTSSYALDFGDMSADPTKHCYCFDPPEVCPPRGTVDLMPCIGIPIYGSKPHFLDVDPQLLHAVEGLHPNRSQHDISVNFEAISGTPVEGYKRLQFSMRMEPVEEFEMMSKLPDLFMPVIWVEESVQLNKTYTNLLKYQLFLAKKFNTATIWLGVLGGAAGLIFSAFNIYQQQSRKTTVSSAVSSNSTVDVERKNLDSITYLSDRVSETAKGNDDK